MLLKCVYVDHSSAQTWKNGWSTAEGHDGQLNSVQSSVFYFGAEGDEWGVTEEVNNLG